MARRTIRPVLEALDALASATAPAPAAEAAVRATLCVARADGVLLTSLLDGAPAAAWSWPADFFTRPRLGAFEEITARDPYPLVSHTRTGSRPPLRLSDVLSEREYRRTAVYAGLLKDLAVPRQLAFSVATGGGRSLCIALGRDGHDFTDDECDHLDALRGPLALAARRPPPVAPPACGRLIGSLSDRELEVLRLAATGLSDVQIGRRLGVAPRTVGKHLENVFRKTDTRNRTEAAAQLRASDSTRLVPCDAFTGAPGFEG